MKKLFISEKPSVAQQFAEALEMKPSGSRRDGYLESEEYIVTWCVGHLVTMSYPEKYDAGLRRWSLETLPFIPKTYLYEVIPELRKQFEIVSSLLKRRDVSCIYVCTDSGREGEYIYRLVEEQAGVKGKERKRVWIDSQTREEILRGIREAKPEEAYDALAAAAYSRAKEDYLMGINFSRALTLRYGREISRRLGREKRTVIAAGRVMTCVLGMIVRREQEIRNFQKTVFYKLSGEFSSVEENPRRITAEFRASENSPRYRLSELYKDSGFLEKERAERFSEGFQPLPREALIRTLEKKKELKNPPLLYNLAELQNEASRLFKISPEETLSVVQELYEKKLTTYPRTDARVLSSAVAKEIDKNLQGLCGLPVLGGFAADILKGESRKKIGSSRYTDDKKITDHYAIIPTGQGIREYERLKPLAKGIYELIVKRFLAIFYPPAMYQKLSLGIECGGELFSAGAKVLKEEGYLCLYRKKDEDMPEKEKGEPRAASEEEDEGGSGALPLLSLRKGQKLLLQALSLREGETSPPKRYSSGSMILAMENAGSLIEDEELRAQIRGSGIGTSATRAGILTKLQKIGYIALNGKTQILSPTPLGELITEAVAVSVRQLLNPELTASWEKGLSYVAEGKISEQEYMEKLNSFVRSRTEAIKKR